MTSSQPETLVRIKAAALLTPAIQTGKLDQSYDEGNVLFPVKGKTIITSGSFMAAAVWSAEVPPGLTRALVLPVIICFGKKRHPGQLGGKV